MQIPVIGRDVELDAGRRLLSAAHDGPAALVVRGEPGIGKTTLLGVIADAAAADGMRVLSCRPAEAEASPSFAGLSDLLSSIDDATLGTLPTPQRQALEIALLRRPPAQAVDDWRAVGTGFVTCLTKLAEDAPVLVCIDDAQWCDRASTRAVEFAVRRVGGHRIAVLAATRTNNDHELPFALERALPADNVEVVTPSPLSLAGVYQLVHETLGIRLDRATLPRVREASGGNPYYALELARAHMANGGHATRDGSLTLSPSLAALVAQRLDHLPPETREALLVVSLAAQPTVDLVTAALGRDGRVVLEPARAADVVHIDEGRIRYEHPLLASGVEDLATEEERHRIRALLATSVTDEEERARHAALGAGGVPDETTAALVAAAAARARDRGALDAAAELAELAVGLTPETEGSARAARALTAAETTFLSGDAARAETAAISLLDSLASGPDRARAGLLAARVAWETRGSLEASRLCDEALADAGDDASLAAEAHSWAAEFSDFDEQRRGRHARAALDLLEQLFEPDPVRLAAALKAFAESELVLGRGIPAAEVARAIELQTRRPPVRVSDRVAVALGWWLVWTDELDEARTLLEAGYGAIAGEGDESSLPHVAGWLRELELRSGNFIRADEYASVQLEAAERQGEDLWRAVALARRALVDAHLGRVERARDDAEYAHVVAEASSDAGLAVLCEWALGFNALSIGDHTGAVDWLDRADATLERIGLVEPGYARFHADHIEALIAVGELERAREALDRLEARGRAVDRASALAGAARCRGLLAAAQGESAAADSAFAEAFVQHERLAMPFELARTLLAHGVVLRHRRRRKDARAALERARLMFESTGAPTWCDRTDAELARVGVPRLSSDELTETEQRVAALAADGLTNREIAARAFLTPKSVEGVLRRVYRSVGVRNKTELAARFAEQRRLENQPS